MAGELRVQVMWGSLIQRGTPEIAYSRNEHLHKSTHLRLPTVGMNMCTKVHTAMVVVRLFMVVIDNLCAHSQHGWEKLIRVSHGLEDVQSLVRDDRLLPILIQGDTCTVRGGKPNNEPRSLKDNSKSWTANLEGVVVDQEHAVELGEVASQGLDGVPGLARGGLVLRGGVLGVAAVQNQAGVVEEGLPRSCRPLQQWDDLSDGGVRGAGVDAQPEFRLREIWNLLLLSAEISDTLME